MYSEDIEFKEKQSFAEVQTFYTKWDKFHTTGNQRVSHEDAQD